MTAKSCGTCAHADCEQAGLVESCERWTDTDDAKESKAMAIYEYEWIELNGVRHLRYDPPRLYSGTLAQVPAEERLRMIQETGRNAVFELEDES